MIAIDDWQATNQHALAEALSSVRTILERFVARFESASDAPDEAHSAGAPARTASALDTLGALFRLSPFERDLLLLCAGIELDAHFPPLCAAAQGDSLRPFPTFSLALAALPDAHWSALTPDGPLRFWRLIEVGAGAALTTSALRIDERILHYLTGINAPDHRLRGLIAPVAPPDRLAPSQQVHVERMVALWSQPHPTLPVFQLVGEDAPGKRAVAAAACARLGRQLQGISAELLPTTTAELETLLLLWERDAALTAGALLLDCEELDATDTARLGAVQRVIERLNGVLLVAARDRLRGRQKPLVALEIARPTLPEQRQIWQEMLGEAAPMLRGAIEELTAQFNVSAQTIHAAGIEAIGHLANPPATGDDPRPLEHLLWDACRGQARPRMEDLAQRIEPAAGWDELVLPAPQKRILEDIAAHVRQRTTVYETWGFAKMGARGLGMSTLFAGASGTGKTMAAEVLASTLRLDLYRIDLSSVVSKYIGETEKNLRRIFDIAEEGGAILLFDEADALFGKRSEVKDSHDRYANIEVSYLLQRMECYRGLAILTTNLRSALDTAFLRRLRFIVQFPFPDAVQRAAIWSRAFPPRTPTDRLDCEKLARLNVTGGNIRSIALNAAFLAADDGTAVGMRHILRAAQNEYAKLEKPLTDAEIYGWL